ncbi:MAG: hypothetical protein AAF985_12035, partial [Bacteroidota bacterium]
MLPTPDMVFKELFTAFHESGLWKDQKTISDAIPNQPPAVILHAYQQEKEKANFNLKSFFTQYFHTAPDL